MRRWFLPVLAVVLCGMTITGGGVSGGRFGGPAGGGGGDLVLQLDAAEDYTVDGPHIALFDLSGSTHDEWTSAELFTRMQCDFDFGDGLAGTYSYGSRQGRSLSEDFGAPIAMHEYAADACPSGAPCTATIKCQVIDKGGAADTAQITQQVVVEDYLVDTATTLCATSDAGGDFPAYCDATLANESNINTIFSTSSTACSSAQCDAIVLDAAHNYDTTAASLVWPSGLIQVGADGSWGGTGVATIRQTTWSGDNGTMINLNNRPGIRVVNLKIQALDTTSQGDDKVFSCAGDAQCQDQQWINYIAAGFHRGLHSEFGGNPSAGAYDPTVWHTRKRVSRYQFQNMRPETSVSGTCHYFWTFKGGFLNSDLGDCNNGSGGGGEFVFRTHLLRKGGLFHVRMGRPGNGKGCGQIRACHNLAGCTDDTNAGNDPDPVGEDAFRGQSRFGNVDSGLFTVRGLHCDMGGSNGSFFGVNPENNVVEQFIADYVIEQSLFETSAASGATQSHHLGVTGWNVEVRNNLFLADNMGSVSFVSAINTTNGGSTVLSRYWRPQDHRIYHNAMVTNDTGAFSAFQMISGFSIRPNVVTCGTNGIVDDATPILSVRRGGADTGVDLFYTRKATSGDGDEVLAADQIYVSIDGATDTGAGPETDIQVGDVLRRDGAPSQECDVTAIEYAIGKRRAGNIAWHPNDGEQQFGGDQFSPAIWKDALDEATITETDVGVGWVDPYACVGAQTCDGIEDLTPISGSSADDAVTAEDVPMDASGKCRVSPYDAGPLELSPAACP